MATRIRCLFTTIALAALACSGSETEGNSSAQRYNPPTAALGRQAVAERACSGCHGKDLSGGNRPITANLMFTNKASDTAACPANLTPDETGLGEWDQPTII